MNLNKAFILGNLTRDPELRQTASGQTVCSFGVATNRFYTDSAGQKQKQAEFHNVVAWGKQAEIITQYLHKGSSILVEGRLQTRSWQDQQGVKHYRTEIVSEQIQLGPRSDSGGGGSGFAGPAEPRSGGENQRSQNAPQLREQAPKDETPIIELPGDEEIDVKEIPF